MSKSLTIPEMVSTPVEDIQKKVDTLRATFRSGRTKDLQYRLRQLRKLYWALDDNAELVRLGLHKDFRKPPHETTIADLEWAKGACMDAINNLEKWAKDVPVPGTPLMFKALSPRIHYEPLGVVLVISAFNYPYQLGVSPAIGALAAGNCVVLKNSESAPYSAMVIQKIFEEALDPDAYTVVNGALEQGKAVLDIKWDKICYTGGGTVGKIVQKAAAEHLTPTILELGGRNPAFVTKNANVKLAARRLLWTKVHNAGQVCVSQNYALVERSVVDEFIAGLKKSYNDYFPNGAKASPDYTRIVNKPSFNKLKKMLDGSNGKIVLGGSTDEADLYIEPTVVLVNDINDTMMLDETFGPIWSIFPFDTLDQAIDIANDVDPTPLTVSTFGSKAENQKVVSRVTSGGATFNDASTHAHITQAPFGGVGTSGTGNYRAVFSFYAFSHARTMATTPDWMDALLRVRYMPYSPKKLQQFVAQTGGKPNFDRNGNVVKGLRYWLGLTLSLGGSSASSTILRPVNDQSAPRSRL
jgi:beta-apo-4'-carotenal oxygenase